MSTCYDMFLFGVYSLLLARISGKLNYSVNVLCGNWIIRLLDYAVPVRKTINGFLSKIYPDFRQPDNYGQY